MMSAGEQMLASTNGLFSFGSQMGQGTKGLLSAQNFQESLGLQKQALAALTRSLNASEQAQRLGNMAVNISNHAVQRVRQMAMLRDQGVNDPFSNGGPSLGGDVGSLIPGPEDNPTRSDATEE